MVPLVTNPIAEAVRYEKLIEELGSKAEVARHLGLSRPRVSQMAALLRLAPKIQEYVLGLGIRAAALGITEAALRHITILRCEDDQMLAFTQLLVRKGLSPESGNTKASIAG